MSIVATDPHIPPPHAYLKLWLIGSFIATIGYGVAVMLFTAYFHNFIHFESRIEPTQQQETAAVRRRSRYFFLLYAVLMLSISTLAFIAGTLATVDAFFPASKPPTTQTAFSLFGEASTLVLASLCTDALMFWRCVVLYKNTSTLKRCLLITFLALLFLASIATGAMFVVTGTTTFNRFMLAFAATATVLNGSITVLIVVRLWHHQKYIEVALGSGFASAYSRLIHLFVESAALIVVFNVTHLILAWWPSHTLVISHYLLTHIYIISAMLIVYRVAGSLQRPSTDSATAILDTELQISDHIDRSSQSLPCKDEESAVSV
ncbi:hypothetical protein CPB83DRAFT_848840 [Crepidotus variabilis]|uniref:Uncharacterized protein n=1 Tax=Crepidotus variabilis TaxID=179855 RepID=A0A9P6EMI1_9AGAR|nr:hypothetical protein CPB83DRAFT_848840 [Crepidotus variabilis]